MTRLRRVAAGLCLMLSACAGGMNGVGNDTPAPQVTMAGRWLLGAPNAPSCGVSLTQAPGAQNGALAPEGGCPGNFFTSRHWAFEQGALAIRDHNGELLAQLSFSGGQFEGKSTAGLPVTLMRPAAPVNQ